jgi:hypothetical protein
MLWSNGGGKPPGMKPAAFANVTKGSRRPPAWVGGDAEKKQEPAPAAREPARQPADKRVPGEKPAAGEKPARAAPSQTGGAAVPRAPRVPTEALDRASLRPLQVSSPPRTSLLAMEMASPLESLRVPAPAVAAATEPSPEMVTAFAAALEGLADARRRLIVESGPELAKLAGAIAKRVIGREVSIDPRIVLALVQEGLDALGQYDRILVRLGPEFDSIKDELAQRLKGRGVAYDLFIDPQLPPYGCIVETDLGRVDEGVEARLEQLFLGLISESNNPSAS